ncbi:MAG: hypothetical protein V3T55_07535, partial [Anaerolineales bacterium]
LAKEGAMFTDWYGQQSCTAGRARRHSRGRQPLLPRCYQNTPYQEHLGAQSLTGNTPVFVRIGPLGSAQVGPGENS